MLAQPTIQPIQRNAKKKKKKNSWHFVQKQFSHTFIPTHEVFH